MAVIQISRIQVRRGKENQGTGVPRLASGELGWAVDSQRLYIGSGSTQEGAPAEGNVRLLTANDNILDFDNQYFYKGIDQDDTPLVTGAVGRSIQDRLDDYVTAKNFGVVGDGIADDYEAIQFAINSLFGPNLGENERSILYLPAGVYLISQPLLIPPFANIIGAGIDNTVIVNNTDTVFKTVGDVGNNSLSPETQSRKVKIKDMTIESESVTESVFVLESCRDSEFRNLRLSGIWDENGREGRHAFEFISNNNTIISENNIFENIYIKGFSKAFYSENKIIRNLFSKINMYLLEKGFEFEGSVDNGATGNIIENSVFERVEKQGIEIVMGDHNISRSNRFINVGNDGGDLPVYPVIDFRSSTNISENDYFERSEIIGPNNATADYIDDSYIPEVRGRTRFENSFPLTTTIGTQGNFVDIFKIPAIEYGTVFVDYIYTVTGQGTADVFDLREGTLEIVVNNSNPNGNPFPIIMDEYKLLGDPALNSLEFMLRPIGETIIVQARNNFSLTSDIFYYNIRSKT